MFFSSGLDVSAFKTRYLFRNIFVMLAMLVVATALISRSVHTRASNGDQLDSQHIVKIFHEDNMTLKFTEQLGSHDHTTDVRMRRDDKNGSPQTEVKTTTQSADIPAKRVLVRNLPKIIAPERVQKANASEDSKKKPRSIAHEDIDVADREDHVTQYLSDQMVNTDSEITSLQASETEDEREGSGSVELTEDKFFAFLTGLEEAVEVDGVWSRPNDVQHNTEVRIPKIEDQKVNAIIDEEYKE